MEDTFSRLALLLTGSAALVLAVRAPVAEERILVPAYGALWSGRGPATALFREALERDPASPFRWCDLAESCLADGDPAGARYCVRRALDQGPEVAPVLLRSANLLWMGGDPDAAVPLWRHVLALTGQYDDAILVNYDRMKLDNAQVLERGLPDGRSARAWFRHLLVDGRDPDLPAAWSWIVERGWADDALARNYVDFLWPRGQFEPAFAAWAAYARRLEASYPDSNLIFNGDFERAFSGVVFDWQTGAAETGDHPYSGSRCLEAEAASLSLSQTVVAAAPGQYRFQAQVRLEKPECGAQVRFRIFDVESPARLDAIAYPSARPGWTHIEENITVPPETRVLRVEAAGAPSTCARRVWIDAVKLSR